MYVADSPYLASDAVFGVKSSLIRDFLEVDDPVRAAGAGLPNPFRALTFGLTLLPIYPAARERGGWLMSLDT